MNLSICNNFIKYIQMEAKFGFFVKKSPFNDIMRND
jgi:hypothetical protein